MSELRAKSSFYERLKAEWQDLEQVSSKQVKKTKKKVKKAHDDLTGFIKEYPYVSVALAFLVGYFLGSIRRRK